MTSNRAIPSKGIVDPFTPATRMHAHKFLDLDGLETDTAGAYSLARRLVALIDFPAPVDPPNSATVTLRSVEAVVSVHGLLADAKEGLIHVTDRSGAEWEVGTHLRPARLMARAAERMPIPLSDLLGRYGPLSLDIPPSDRVVELAARIQSLLLLHGIRATAVPDHDRGPVATPSRFAYDRITLSDPTEETTSPDWLERVEKILRTHYGVTSEPSGRSLVIEVAKVIR